MPKLAFTAEAQRQLQDLRADRGLAVRLRAVQSALGKIQIDPRQNGLHTHEYKGRQCPHGGKLLQSYAQNRTPGAYRIFWCYMPSPAYDTILIVAITPHP